MFHVVPVNIDFDLVVNSISRFYGRWVKVSREPSSFSYNVLLEKCSGNVEFYDINTVRICIDKETPYSIARAIEFGRAWIRQAISWDGRTYRLFMSYSRLEDYEVHPAYDLFIWRSGFEQEVLKSIGLKSGLNPLIHKRFGGEYIIYSGSKPTAKLHILDEGFIFKGEQLSIDLVDNDLGLFIESNKPILHRHIIIVRKFLDSLGEPDIVVVSFSGGKDSLVTLDLAVKHFGNDMVRGVYVDTGVDFDETRKYVGTVAEKIGIEIEYVYAPVKELVSRHGFPSKKNRWCTLVKTQGFKKALSRYIERYRRVLVLVGDRDSESEARARKPPVRRRKKYLEASPIKQWSTIHVQLYTWINNLPENPLYKRGFYRLGCYICPALTSLEKYIMIKYLYRELKDKPLFKEYLKHEGFNEKQYRMD